MKTSHAPANAGAWLFTHQAANRPESEITMIVNCSGCGTNYIERCEIQYDEAPPSDPPHLVRMDIPDEPGERSDCCPKCKTDAYLSDAS